MSVKDILGADGKILSSYITGGGGGGVASVTAGANIDVNSAISTAPVVSLQSPLTAELDLGQVAVKDSTGSVGTNGQVLSSTGTKTEWIAGGGGGSGTVTAVSAGPGLIVTGNASSTPQVNMAFAAAGDLIVGSGLNTGVVLTKGSNGTFLQVSSGGLLVWGAGGGGGGGTTIYRNSVDDQPLIISKPTTANDTCIITADRTYQTFAPATIYSQVFVNPQAGSQDLLANPAWFNWTAPADLTLTGFTGSFYIASNQQFPDGTSILCSCNMVNTGTTTVVASAQFSIPKDGASSYNFTGTPQAGPSLNITNGQVFQFQITIDGQIPLGGTYFASNNGTGLVGVMNIQANQYTNTPAQFTLQPPAKFRTNNDLIGKTSATCASFASQSFVATADTADWVMVGGLNGGVGFIV